MAGTNPIIIPREVLLVEIDRRCSFPDCDSRMAIGLTKAEASDYAGFECEHCQRWNDDKLTPKDIPDWWDEINTLKQAN
jgi:hypothetical protein